MNISVEIFTKKDCCLCDDAKDVLKEILSEFPTAQMQITDIESDFCLIARFKEKIPVVTLNGEEVFCYKIHPITLRKKIQKILSQAKEN